MSTPPYLRADSAGVMLAVKVQPRAAANQVVDVMGNELRIKVTAPPVDSAANEALIRFLAERLDCGRNQIDLVRGGTSRHKVIKIRGLDIKTIVGRLKPA